MAKALDGIKVLDLTRLLPGGVCTMLLADMGADVVKVEDPVTGDYARWTPPLVDGLGAFFRASNRNKRSIIINLKQMQGQRIFHKLVASADVVIEGFRPGVTQRLNVDYDTLQAINPRLVYCSLSGWGQEGPYQHKSGHDLNYIALNGLLGSTRNPQPLGGQVADVGGAYVGVMGICAALFKRERTGQGEWVKVSLFESAMPFALYQLVETMTMGLPGGDGTLTGGMAFYNVYWSKDDLPMTLAAIEPKFWENFCNAVGHPEWIAEHLNLPAQETLKKKIRAVFRNKTAAEWNDLLANVDCCFALVTPPEKLLDDPQVQALGAAGMGADGIVWMRSPVRMQDDEFAVGPIPDYGEHTDAVLAEAGFSPEEIALLHQSDAIGRREITAD